MKEEQALSEIGRLSRELTAAKSALKQAERALESVAAVGERGGKLHDGEWIDLHPRNHPPFVLEQALDPADFRRARQALSSIRQTENMG